MNKYPKIVFITGAGVSVLSGIPPFRGPNGVYTKQPDLKYKLRPDSFETDPQFLYDFHNDFKTLMLSKKPNELHQLIALLKAPVITMNIDNFHELAGSLEIVHVHGSVNQVRCRSCSYKENRDFKIDDLCPECGKKTLRHDVVLFKESIMGVNKADQLVREADILIQIGTSGNVYPMAELPARCNGYKVCINPEKPLNAHLFTKVLIGDPVEILKNFILNLNKLKLNI